ncbi:HAD family hydrolase [Streptomyces parvus]|uniref:hypothetical protein n=1 Tax=Streptomyces parvus TaxID=66428 RepID=UPI0021CCC92D|nr:hypothetical protein [Streptomyces parvus]
MSRARRVLVVGIDGVRLDTLRRVPTPHLDAVAVADGGPSSASPRRVVDTVLRTLGGEAFRTTVADGESDPSKPFPDLYPKAAGCRVPAVPTAAPIAPAPGGGYGRTSRPCCGNGGRRIGYDVTS